MKTKIKTILLPVDFSGYSAEAFTVSRQIASKTGATIILLHVVEPPYNTATAIEGMLSIMEDNAKSKINQLIKKYSESGDTEVDIVPVVKHGRTVREIMKQADECSADLIVMGSKGQSGIERIVLGSVSSAMVAETNVPLFVLPAEKSSRTPDFKRIIFTTNLREKDPENLRYVHSFAKFFAAKLDVIHVTDHKDFDTILRVKGFRQVIRELNLDPPPEFTVLEHENSLVGLAEYISKHSRALLVMNRYKHSIVQKLLGVHHTEKFRRYSDLPILILP
ncbi:universal stress protein [Rhodohalobacter sp. SW132]|uniref:universal stress protein n=1 Tax=Rhodohalobacter sp. SW132 TaxID=2293433 RepID=UPI000E26E5D0|nr:universal stress protein [Rhodohalobacter sp. SW132]REL24046.1 universal stress protein [Rhodohalobacter sp. SW132]